MVNKRGRSAKSKSHSARKSDDDNDSSTDDEFSQEPTSPIIPKRYGLRQRKNTVFCDDLDYEEEEILKKAAVRVHSDDEDYEVHLEEKRPTKKRIKSQSIEVTVQPEVQHTDVPELPMIDDGPIDFEDVIRADVVVMNKPNHINQNGTSKKTRRATTKERGRRGRKPKAKPLTDSEDSMESDVNPIQSKNVTKRIQPARAQHKRQPVIEEEADDDDDEPAAAAAASSPKENYRIAPSVVETIEKFVPPELDAKVKEVVLSNEYLLGNSFELSADEFLQKQAETVVQEEEEDEQILPPINFDDSDDDVVIIEKKPEIIVLDDD